jgi:hypothetical protein
MAKQSTPRADELAPAHHAPPLHNDDPSTPPLHGDEQSAPPLYEERSCVPLLVLLLPPNERLHECADPTGRSASRCEAARATARATSSAVAHEMRSDGTWQPVPLASHSWAGGIGISP